MIETQKQTELTSEYFPWFYSAHEKSVGNRSLCAQGCATWVAEKDVKECPWPSSVRLFFRHFKFVVCCVLFFFFPLWDLINMFAFVLFYITGFLTDVPSFRCVLLQVVKCAVLWAQYPFTLGDSVQGVTSFTDRSGGKCHRTFRRARVRSDWCKCYFNYQTFLLRTNTLIRYWL